MFLRAVWSVPTVTFYERAWWMCVVHTITLAMVTVMNEVKSQTVSNHCWALCVCLAGVGMAVVSRYNSFLLGIVFASITWAVSLYLYSVITQESSARLATTSKVPLIGIPTRDNSDYYIDANQQTIISDALLLKSPPIKKANPKVYHVESNDIDIPLERKAEGKSAHSIKNEHYLGGYKNSDALIRQLQPKTLKPEIEGLGMVKTVEDQALRREGYKVHAFNVLVSRELSYHRDIPDTRHHLWVPYILFLLGHQRAVGSDTTLQGTV